MAANEPADVSDVDISNQHLVGWRGDGLTIVIPPIPSVPIPADEALVFAAWIVCLADPLGDRFAAIMKRVQST